MDEILGLLDAYEPEYQAAAGLAAGFGPHIQPIFEQLILDNDDVIQASRVTYLVSLLDLPESLDLLLKAADPERSIYVRMAAADGAHNLRSGLARTELLNKSLADRDERVLKVALDSVFPDVGTNICDQIRRIQMGPYSASLHRLAAEVFAQSCGGGGLVVPPPIGGVDGGFIPH